MELIWLPTLEEYKQSSERFSTNSPFMIVLVQIERQEIGTVAVTWIQQVILERKRKNQLQLKVRFPSL